jgi:hypothetical protein
VDEEDTQLDNGEEDLEWVVDANEAASRNWGRAIRNALMEDFVTRCLV